MILKYLLKSKVHGIGSLWEDMVNIKMIIIMIVLHIIIFMWREMCTRYTQDFVLITKDLTLTQLDIPGLWS